MLFIFNAELNLFYNQKRPLSLCYNLAMKVSSAHNDYTIYSSSYSSPSKDAKQTEENSKTASSANHGIDKLTQEQRQQLSQLQQRDSEVRSHEAAHLAAGGSVVSGSASFTYQKGPDGRLYAIGGEVPISSPTATTPQEQIEIARQIQAAALAPASPSPQDFKVAASAAMMEAQARQELSVQKSEELKQKAIDSYGKNKEENENGIGLDISA